MDGLLVVGLQHGVKEGAVGAAITAVARRSGAQVAHVRAIALGDRDAEALHAYDAVASPVIAARHQGEQLDPAELARSIDGGVVTVPGGLLAAITTRYTVRDLAAELNLPVVLVASATPDATNLVRLSLAAARAARLLVRAVVLTGWPDPPSRVQLDEHKLLSELAGVSVLTLPESPGARADAVRDWPVADWMAAPPDPAPEPTPRPRTVATLAPAPAAPPAGELGLEPFTAWTPRPTGDPRSTPRPRIMEAMLEIIAAEGPMRATRAYALYNKASGGKKLTTIARAPLSSALHWLAQERKITMVKRDEIPWQDDEIVRMPDQPAVRVRELGDRTLEEVPLDEIAELMHRMGNRDDAALKRGVLGTYGLVRLTQRADEYLTLAIGLRHPPGGA